jgi:TP901 family phage tail tape measure protein
MDDLSVAIGLMANSSVKGSRAGTAMRTLLANLSAPTETVAKAMEKYGIELITAKDGSVDLDKTLRNLRNPLILIKNRDVSEEIFYNNIIKDFLNFLMF